MHKYIHFGWAVLAVALAGWGGAGEAGDEPPPLVSHEALQKRLSEPEPGPRLLDARPRAEYEKGHIPGAVWVDVKAAQALAARKGGLTDRAAWEAWIAPLGIGPETEVLVYDGKRQLDAARTWWLLRYLGVDRVGLIDGNFAFWACAGRPVSSDQVKVSPRPFKVAFRADRHATRDDVLKALKEGQARVIDARGQDEFTGKQKMSKRGGHIPAACHLEWSNLVDDHGRFIAAAALKERLKKLGIKDGQPVITHCQSGGRASVEAFALERIGLPTRNYYLGWSDWGNAEETPIATGAETESGPKP